MVPWMEGAGRQGVKVSTQSVLHQNVAEKQKDLRIGRQMERIGMRFHLWVLFLFTVITAQPFSHQFLSDEIKVSYSGWVRLDRANTAAGRERCFQKQHGESMR